MPSIISSDDIQEAQFTKPMLTTVSLPKEDMGKFATVSAAGPTERRTFRYCPDGTGRKAGDPEQLQQCGGQYVERLLYLRIADMMRYEIFAALTEYMREKRFQIFLFN